ncbi:LOW QUALITY PROTEIN: actin-related protein 8-like [Sinocyclocheilus anshuiensis]|uniref:LOW QUALITY PROTEIN: actin-related protein 8-like n=1 Tax=Sinocyclocheilus anshuiensis TaxID=1608454 RepID=UPI0007B93A63|nr:PREDICTED: LOW QUALITY PROTEIN: actin-related protein 8-like [Sinocyclocheilus anshuiensis]
MTQTDRDAENGRDREKEQRGVKRPVVPAAVPEPLQEQIQANFIVVIHPGSKSLRMGRATDTLPITVPQVIAHRHKQPGQRRYEDQCLLREGLNATDSNEQRQNGLKMVDQVIWSKKMSNGVRRTPVRQHVKEVVNMLLVKMGFSAVVVHQESVCVTFGSGLSSACVVDVGDQKTSVCCVEDGVSHRSSRLCLAYGGSDVTRCFFWLMQRAGFPYRECQLSSKLDCMLLQQLKESFCHLDQDISGLQDHEFRTRFPDSPVLLYQLRLGDEKLQAPMALFYPAAFGIVGQKMTSLLHRSQGDAEDPHDEHFLLTTQSKQDQSSKATTDRKLFPKPAGFEGESNMCDPSEKGNLTQDLDLGHAQAECLVGGADAEETSSALLSRKTAMTQFEGKALGVDKAILHSIDSCASDETKRKMYSCILVVGGGLLFLGAQEFLQHRVLHKMPPSFRRLVENVDVITRPKDMDPRVIAWKGGAVLACLDTTQELWIHQREWQRFGVRMLRERAAFVW